MKTFSVGGTVAASERFKLGLDATYTKADEAMRAIDLGTSAAILAVLKFSTYDFGTAHTYSDLSSTFLDLTARAEWTIAKSVSATARYTWLDYKDDAPYIEDQTGSLGIVQVGLRWAF